MQHIYYKIYNIYDIYIYYKIVYTCFARKWNDFIQQKLLQTQRVCCNKMRIIKCMIFIKSFMRV